VFDKGKSDMSNKQDNYASALDSSQAQNPCSGEAHDLKTIREKRGITLQDIYLESRVSVKNLNAIENRNYSLLPSPFIAKSFIKTYANAIGVNAEAIIGDYEKYVKTTTSSLGKSSGLFIKS
jgi:cytoskeletal protein RodZ